MTVGGAIMGDQAEKKAGRANKRQQDQALQFQQFQLKRSLQDINKGGKGAIEGIMGGRESAQGNLMAALARGGWGDNSAMGLGAMRAEAMDTKNAIGDIHRQMAMARAAARQGQEFPMIQHTASQAGAGLMGAGGQMIGMGMWNKGQGAPGGVPSLSQVPHKVGQSGGSGSSGWTDF
jgi:hypothetical protein